MISNNQPKKLVLPATTNLPFVDFDSQTGVFIIKGRSFSENALPFYEQINAWVEAYLSTKPTSTYLTIAFQYLNTSSGVQIYSFLKTLHQSKVEGNSLTVIWGYEDDDDDLQQVGADFSSALGLPFEFKVVEFE